MVETETIPARSEVPVEYTWDLTTLYEGVAAWEQDVEALEAMSTEIAALKGTLAQGPDALLHALQMRDEALKRLWRIRTYARMARDIDGTDTAAQALDERSGSLAARFLAGLSFMDPEILSIPPAEVSAWQRESPELAPYDYYLDQLMRMRPHVRSAEVEEIMAEYSDVTRAPSDTYDVLTTTDLSFPTVEDAEGKRVQLSVGRYFTLVESPEQRVRRSAFQAFFDTYGSIRTTCATTLGATVRGHALGARLRNYGSSLEAALMPNDVPVEVYHNLLSTVEANVPRLHRYIELRKQILGLDEIHPYDLYVPLVPDVQAEFDYSEATDMVRAAFGPLGSDYGAALEEVLSSRWIDVYENVGKTSGAYSGGSYTTPPFILLNYQGRLNDVYTVAHELGHTMHSLFTRRSQPFISGDYTIFVAEVASTLNEALLTGHLLRTTDDPAFRRLLISKQLDSIRSTIFRQTLFAQFELDMHRWADAGEPITAEGLSDRYYELMQRYYGPGLTLDEEIKNEWAFIPHFYFDFYVYQYATGMSAALALYNRIIDEGDEAVSRYLHFLQSGSSRSPIDLLEIAGVDMTSPQPIQLAMDRFERLLDDLEAIQAQDATQSRI